jgi:hypothetical protein
MRSIAAASGSPKRCPAMRHSPCASLVFSCLARELADAAERPSVAIVAGHRFTILAAEGGPALDVKAAVAPAGGGAVTG